MSEDETADAIYCILQTSQRWYPRFRDAYPTGQTHAYRCCIQILCERTSFGTVVKWKSVFLACYDSFLSLQMSTFSNRFASQSRSDSHVRNTFYKNWPRLVISRRRQGCHYRDMKTAYRICRKTITIKPLSIVIKFSIILMTEPKWKMFPCAVWRVSKCDILFRNPQSESKNLVTMPFNHIHKKQ